MSDKVEKVTGGEPREFSAVKGQGKGARGPEGKHYEDKKANPSILKKEGE